MKGKFSINVDQDQSVQDRVDAVAALPSATVISLRDTDAGMEVLLIRRNPELSSYGGMWVFPGGGVERSDHSLADDHDLVAAARRAAVRETAEEAGLRVHEENLIPVSHWTTPEEQPKRFATWFFATYIGEQIVEIDGQESCDYRWLRPVDILEARRAGELALMPPTFVSVLGLSQYASSEEALTGYAVRRPGMFLPRVRMTAEGFCQLYEEDVSYEGAELDIPGRRHRLWGIGNDWQYERTDA